MLLCVNFDKDEFNYHKFELDIHSETKLDSIRSNLYFNMKKKTFEIYGKWDNYNSGGSPQEPSFTKNPHYEITVPKATDAYIELKSQNNFLISLMVTEVDSSNVADTSPEDIKYSEELHYIRYKFEPNKKYLLIPFTKQSKQYCYFDIKISTDEEISVKEIMLKLD
jgi:hypothetical protein